MQYALDCPFLPEGVNFILSIAQRGEYLFCVLAQARRRAAIADARIRKEDRAAHRADRASRGVLLLDDHLAVQELGM